MIAKCDICGIEFEVMSEVDYSTIQVQRWSGAYIFIRRVVRVWRCLVKRRVMWFVEK